MCVCVCVCLRGEEELVQEFCSTTNNYFSGELYERLYE